MYIYIYLCCMCIHSTCIYNIIYTCLHTRAYLHDDWSLRSTCLKENKKRKVRKWNLPGLSELFRETIGVHWPPFYPGIRAIMKIWNIYPWWRMVTNPLNMDLRFPLQGFLLWMTSGHICSHVSHVASLWKSSSCSKRQLPAGRWQPSGWYLAMITMLDNVWNNEV